MILAMLKTNAAKDMPLTAAGVDEVREDLSRWEVSESRISHVFFFLTS